MNTAALSPYTRQSARLFRSLAILFLLFCLACSLHAQVVPQLVSYQGRVAVGALNFTGAGAFKFALVDPAGAVTYWSNDGTSTAGAPPTAAVALTVTNGLYSVLLGDTTVANMTAIPAGVWANPDVRLRVWFDDGVDGSQLLTPDQRLAPNGYLPDGAVTSAKIAPGAVTGAQLAAGAVGTPQLAAHAVQSANLATGSVGSVQLAPGATAVPLAFAGTGQAVAANTAYSATGATRSNFVLPLTANIGDMVQITGTGAGGWYAVTGGAAFLWSLQSGSLVLNWLPLASSSDGSHLAAAPTTGQIYTSPDYGATWTLQAGSPSGTWGALASSADGSRLAGITSNSPFKLYTSADSGVTWAQQTSGLPTGTAAWTSVASSADGTHLALSVNGGTLYTSADSGVTWTARTTGLPATATWRSVTTSVDGSHLVAVATNTAGKIYTSVDSGATWVARTSGLPATNTNYQSVTSSADGTRLVAVSGTAVASNIYTSADAGATWTSQAGAPVLAWRSVASSSDGTRLVVASSASAQLYVSLNGGVNWTAQAGAPTATWRTVTISGDGARLAATPSNKNIYTALAPGISGAQGTAIALQYQGNGLWAAIGQSQVAAGAVGSSQIAGGAIQAANIANGAIGSTQLAAGAVQSANIATGAVGTAQMAVGAIAAPIAATAPWQFTTSNATYSATGTGHTTFYLPPSANVGDTVQIDGLGAGGWSAVPVGTDSPNWVAPGGLDVNSSYYCAAVSSDGTHMVILANTGVYTSANSGVIWARASSFFPGSTVNLASSADCTRLLVANGTTASISLDSGATWNTLSIPAAVTAAQVAMSVDGSRLLVGGAGGLAISTDSGATWSTPAALATLTCSALASSADGTHLAAAVAGVIYTSADAGATWTPHSGPTTSRLVSSLDGSRLSAAASDGVYTSSDFGATWTHGLSIGTVLGLASSGDGTRLAAVNFSSVYLSSDAGVTWTLQTFPAFTFQKAFPAFNFQAAALSAGGEKILITTLFSNSIVPRVAVGTFAGTTITGAQGSMVTMQYLGHGVWAPAAQSQVAAGLPAGSVQAATIAAGSVGTSQLAAGALSAAINAGGSTQSTVANTAYNATGAGSTAFALPTNANFGDVVQITGLGAGGWTATTPLLQYTWTNAAGLPINWKGLASSADGTHLAAVQSNPPFTAGQIYTSSNSGATWAVPSGSPTGVWQAVASSADGTRLVAVAQSSDGSLSIPIYISRDSGVTWTTPSGGPLNSWLGVASSADGRHLTALAQYNFSSFHSDDFGATWAQNFASTSGNQAIASSADGTRLIMSLPGDVNTPGRIYLSTDAGMSTTTPTTGVPASAHWSGVASSADGSHLAAVVNGGAIYTSADFGVTWTALANAPSTDWHSIAISADGSHLIAAAGSQLLYLSTDFGASWTTQSGAPSGWNIVTFSADGWHVFAAGADGSIYVGAAAFATVASGAQHGATTLQYQGGGVWTPIAQSQVAAGSVGSAQLASGLTLGGTTTGTFSGNGAGLTNINFPSAGNYFNGYSTATQAATTAFQTVTLTNVTPANGWTQAGSVLTVPATGLYLIQYDGSLALTAAATATVRVLNGVTEIAGSQAAVALTAAGKLPISRSFIVNLTAATTLTFQMDASANSAVSLAPLGDGITKPAFSCTITRLQ